MTYRIYLKGQPISPSPNGSWPSREGAEQAIIEFEREEPRLKGKLEVRGER
jgi:hypothetical protein